MTVIEFGYRPTGTQVRSIGALMANLDQLADKFDGNINDSDLADNAVRSRHIQASAVGTSELADDAVTAAKIADDAVGTAQIADDAIIQALLADDSVGTAQIQDDAVTQANLADNSVGATQLADDAVTVLTSSFTTFLVIDHTVTTTEADVPQLLFTAEDLAVDEEATYLAFVSLDVEFGADALTRLSVSVDLEGAEIASSPWHIGAPAGTRSALSFHFITPILVLNDTLQVRAVKSNTDTSCVLHALKSRLTLLRIS